MSSAQHQQKAGQSQKGQNEEQRRRIQYVPAQKLSNASIASVKSGNNNNTHASSALVVGMPPAKNNNQDNNQGNNAVFAKKASPPLNSELGLFPPALAGKYLRWLKMRRVGPGFYNEGNTCFLNSTLQCLLYLPTFSQCLLSETKDALKGIKVGDEKNRTVIELYSNLVKDVWSEAGSNRAISPRGMVNCIRRVGKQFKPFRQEDAHEYLRQLLDCMHEEVLKQNGLKTADGKKAETTVISRIFGGYLCNTLTCTRCQYTSKTYNHFQDLSLEIRQGIQGVENAIDAFTKLENLTQGNEWKCDGCKNKVKATKQMTIQEVPNVLVLHLKRFSFGNMFGKITKHITFPASLNVPYDYNGSSKNAKQAKYELTGVIVHHGGSTHSGHYIAYVKAPNGQWHEMNDSTVSVVSINKVLQAQAYVIFYTKVPTEAQMAESKPKEEVKKAVVEPVKPVKPVVESSSESSSSEEEEDKENDEEEEMDLYNSDDDMQIVPMYGPMRFKGAIHRFQQWKIPKILVPIYTLGKIMKERNAKRGREEDEKETVEVKEEIVVDEVDSEDSESASDSESDSESQHSEVSHDEGSALDEIPEKKATPVPVPVPVPTGLIHGGGRDVVAALLEQSRRGRNVGGEGIWETVSSEDQGKIHQIAVQQRRKDQDVRKQQRVSDWDMLLDQGKTKKVKTHFDDPKEPSAPQDKYSPFQRVSDDRERQKDVQGTHVDMRFDPVVKHQHRKKNPQEQRHNQNSKFSSHKKSFQDSRNKPNFKKFSPNHRK